MLNKIDDNMRGAIGNDMTDFGTHSVRKGGITYVMFFVGLYAVIDIFARIGWSIGGTERRYIFQSPGRPSPTYGLNRVNAYFTSTKELIRR